MFAAQPEATRRDRQRYLVGATMTRAACEPRVRLFGLKVLRHVARYVPARWLTANSAMSRIILLSS